METTYRVAEQMIMLAKETQRNQDDIKQMRREIDEMARAIERLAYEIKRTGDVSEFMLKEIISE